MRIALSEMVVGGISTNIPLHLDLLSDAAFLNGGIGIHFLSKSLPTTTSPAKGSQPICKAQSSLCDSSFPQ
jgi:acetyl-CoA carboxylase biotin carboxylase subunit